MDSAVHEEERRPLGQDFTRRYGGESAHFQKSKKLYHWSGYSLTMLSIREA
jgi:hypothetical protein